MQFNQIWLNSRWQVFKHDTLASTAGHELDFQYRLQILYLHRQNAKKTVSRQRNLRSMSKLNSCSGVLLTTNHFRTSDTQKQNTFLGKMKKKYGKVNIEATLMWKGFKSACCYFCLYKGDFAQGISRQWRPLVCASSSCQKELQSGSDEEVAHLIFVTDTTAVSVWYKSARCKE